MSYPGRNSDARSHARLFFAIMPITTWTRLEEIALRQGDDVIVLPEAYPLFRTRNDALACGNFQNHSTVCMIEFLVDESDIVEWYMVQHCNTEWHRHSQTRERIFRLVHTGLEFHRHDVRRVELRCSGSSMLIPPGQPRQPTPPSHGPGLGGP